MRLVVVTGGRKVENSLVPVNTFAATLELLLLSNANKKAPNEKKRTHARY